MRASRCRYRHERPQKETPNPLDSESKEEEVIRDASLSPEPISMEEEEGRADPVSQEGDPSQYNGPWANFWDEKIEDRSGA